MKTTNENMSPGARATHVFFVYFFLGHPAGLSYNIAWSAYKVAWSSYKKVMGPRSCVDWINKFKHVGLTCWIDRQQIDFGMTWEWFCNDTKMRLGIYVGWVFMLKWVDIMMFWCNVNSPGQRPKGVSDLGRHGRKERAAWLCVALLCIFKDV